jgi:4-amino-4-deoxy-L-arabinose transferase-like glycosyltransferase
MKVTREQRARWLAVAITLLAFFLRVWQLDEVPPGWSDDELSDMLVIAQKVFQGDFSVYYVDATGLEAPYFMVAGVFLRLLGFNALGIRLLSALLGTLAIPLLYQVGRRAFSPRVGLLAAALLATSFWALIYSRVNIRHISLPVFVLGTVFFFWQGIRPGRRRSFMVAGLWMGLGFYTYFASRGVPLILIAFGLYLWLADRPSWQRTWRGQLLTLLLALTLSVPLVISLLSQEGADARVVEVAVPLAAARDGDFEPLWNHASRTLRMFHADGDDEFLYNIPGRPVFGPLGALALAAGLLVALWYALQPLRRAGPARPEHLAAGFLLLWWLAGITPGFLSVPPASLGHTIDAPPATYLRAALPLQPLGRLAQRRWLLPALALLLVIAGAARNLPDYFQTWPQRGNTRYLYHADIRDVAGFLAEHPEMRDFAISGLLAGPWDREALRIDMANAGVSGAQPRWYNPQRAIFLALGGQPAVAFAGYPLVETAYGDAYERLPMPAAGGYTLSRVRLEAPVDPALACFGNGLCLLQAEYVGESGVLHLTWKLAEELALPHIPLLSIPPPPDADASPRLAVFAHLLDGSGSYLAGDDGLWVDPETLRPGDVFRQQHFLRKPASGGASAVSVGLYDPLTSERWKTETGQASVQIPLPEASR